MRNKLFIITIMLISIGCSKRSHILDQLSDLEDQFDHHSGFVLMDPESNKVLLEHNGNKYFTPASNTKVLTFYTCLKTLQDSLITFYIEEKNDSEVLWPAGDPTFLNPEFPESNVFNTLKQLTENKTISISFQHSYIAEFGPGWAWEDYTFTSERTALPLYGNYLILNQQNDSLSINIPYFKRHIYVGDSLPKVDLYRDVHSNYMVFFPGRNEEDRNFEVPYVTSNWLTTRLLGDTLNRNIFIKNLKFNKDAHPVYSHTLDTAYKKMMQESNNFVAEQLLLQCSMQLFDTLNTERVINYAKDNYLNFLPQSPVWIDGSGLSRYNLVTPVTMTALWSRILKEYGRDRIFPLLATGGISGTLKNYYKAEKPYIYAKTGTLSNNHNLSGYIITKSGRILVFAFMNNNYPTYSKPIKNQMEKIMWEVYTKY